MMVCALALFAACSHSQDGSSPRLDFSGIEQFLSITALLMKEQEPSEAQWDELFATSGYRTLREHEPGYSPKFFKNRFNLVFRPSLRSRLEARLEQLDQRRATSWYDGMEYRVLRHYCRVRDARSELLQYCKSFRKSALYGDARRLAAGYLPAGSMKRHAGFSFLIFAPDARGYSPILLDLGRVMFHTNPAGLIAHEMHHYYIQKLWQFNASDVDEGDHRLLYALGQIYKEGIADQIDKPALHYGGGHAEILEEESSREYHRLVENTPELLRKLDRILSDMAEHPEKRYELGRRFAASVPRSGHPTGFYMARTIIEVLGKKALVEDAGNPFAFVRKFHRAAGKKGPACGSFSDAAMSVVKRLEKKYVIDGYSWNLGRFDPPVAGLDLRSVDCFFEIVSFLEREKEPAPAQWSALFATYGYHDLIKGEGDRFGREHHFKKYLRLVFTASAKIRLEAELKRLRKEEPQRWKDVMHLCEVREHKSSLIAFARELRDRSTIEEAMKILANYLPEAALEGRPGVCFLVFSNDWRASGNPVLVDLLLAQRSPLGPVKFTARWFWYYFADRALVYDLGKVDRSDLPVLRRMARVYREGIANLIGARYEVRIVKSKTARAASRFHERIAAMPETLARLDAILAGLADESSDRTALGRKFSAAVPGTGGELGYYMATTIAGVLGMEALRDAAGNPFAFFRIFNKAAAGSDAEARSFSGEAMKELLRLEEKYARGLSQGR